MATIKAIIRATKGKDTAFVRFRISDGRNVQLFYKSPISVKVELWDAKREGKKWHLLSPEACIELSSTNLLYIRKTALLFENCRL